MLTGLGHILKRGARRVASGVRKAKLRARATAGFTLTEALATVIIIGLVTATMAGGVALASKQFTRSIAHSQAQQLYSSLAQTIDNDLRYTNTYYGSSDNVTGYTSFAHGVPESKKNIVLGDDAKLYLKTLASDGNEQDLGTPGELALCNDVSTNTDEGKNKKLTNRLVGRGSYNNGLKASITSFTYDTTSKLFSIELVISQVDSDGNATTFIDQTFTVKALNNPTASN